MTYPLRRRYDIKSIGMWSYPIGRLCTRLSVACRTRWCIGWMDVRLGPRLRKEDPVVSGSTCRSTCVNDTINQENFIACDNTLTVSPAVAFKGMPVDGMARVARLKRQNCVFLHAQLASSSPCQ